MARVKTSIPEQKVHGYEAARGSRVAQTFAAREARRQLPRIAPSPDFLLQVHPLSWDVRAGQVVPVARKLQVVPGVNNVDARRGVPDVSRAVLARNERGWVVVSPEWYSDEDGDGYVMRHPVQGGGVAHLTVFERCYPGSNRIDNDDEAEAAWWGELIKSGKIPGPSPAALEELRDRCQTAWVRATNRRRADESWAAEAEASKARLDVVEAALQQSTKKQNPSKGRRAAAREVKS